MNRRQMAFIILMNALISLAIALAVAWAIEARRPDPEELSIPQTSAGGNAVVVIATPIVEAPTPAPAAPVVEQPTATAAPEIAPTITISGDAEVYIVQTGDSLGSIAGKFNVSVADLIAVNPELKKNPDLVFSGLPLTIPKAGAAALVATPTPDNSTAPATELLLKITQVEAPGNLISERVQIVNDGAREVNLAGWQLRRENGLSHTFGNLSLFPGSGIWLHSRTGEDTSVAVYWKQSAAVWASGAQVQLVNPAGVVVTSYLVP